MSDQHTETYHNADILIALHNTSLFHQHMPPSTHALNTTTAALAPHGILQVCSSRTSHFIMTHTQTWCESPQQRTNANDNSDAKATAKPRSLGNVVVVRRSSFVAVGTLDFGLWTVDPKVTEERTNVPSNVRSRANCNTIISTQQHEAAEITRHTRLGQHARHQCYVTLSCVALCCVVLRLCVFRFCFSCVVVSGGRHWIAFSKLSFRACM